MLNLILNSSSIASNKLKLPKESHSLKSPSFNFETLEGIFELEKSIFESLFNFD